MLISAMGQTDTRDCPYRNTTEPEVSGTLDLGSRRIVHDATFHVLDY